MNIRREKFLHADGRTPSTDVAGKWKKVFHRDEVTLLVARYLGGHLQVHFMFAGDDAYKIARLIANKASFKFKTKEIEKLAEEVGKRID